jgi:DNA-directed RNA polymerase specialized sigma24 family protein
MITNEVTVTNESGKSHYARTNPCDRSGEQALVAAAQAGVTDAMDELLARHKTALYRAARRFTRSHEDAEDLVQDAMFRAFVNVQEVGGPSRWDFFDARPNPEQQIMQQELRTFLHAILLRQSPTHQIILERCVFDEVRIADAASSLELTIGSAKSSLYRARRRVSDSFERRGLVKRRNPQNKLARRLSA